jgi:hypothetical protein
MWLCLAESVRGTSHVERDSECQDYCEVQVEDSSAFVFAVADGAGSAKLSAVGAKSAVAQFCAEARALGVTENATRESVFAATEKIRSAIIAEANARGCEVRELASTLLGGYVTPNRSWFFQIGDGAIVAQENGSYRPLTWPVNGEYANSTIFLTSADWAEHAQFLIVETQLSEVAAFTDGMQELILRHGDRSVHAPFFTGLMETMRSVPDVTILAEPLRAFLNSKAVNDRTDDDKTLLLACWAK